MRANLAGNLKAWAQEGVTTVGDLGTDQAMDHNFVRSELLRGESNARLVIAGPMLTEPGGHPMVPFVSASWLPGKSSGYRHWSCGRGWPRTLGRGTGESQALRGGEWCRSTRPDYGGYSNPFGLGLPATEIALMYEAGMTPMQIIAAATCNAARVCGLGDQIGTLEPGRIADILVVEGNPLEDLDNLSNARLVVHNGRIIRGLE